MKKLLCIALPGGVLIVLALFTVLNKKWWAARIFQKWDTESNMANNPELLKSTSLTRFIEVYRKGMDGWTLRGTKATVGTDSTIETEA
jgi:hypothetical protein